MRNEKLKVQDRLDFLHSIKEDRGLTALTTLKSLCRVLLKISDTQKLMCLVKKVNFQSANQKSSKQST